jgi:SAM-dependent methyltransferase
MSIHRQFIAQLTQSILDEHFIKLSLGNYNGDEPDLKNIYVKPVLIKRELKLSFTYRYQRRDITKNYLIEEGISQISALLQIDGFWVATLFTTFENRICQLQKGGKWTVRTEKPTTNKPASLTHDKQKERKLGSSTKGYLHELKLTNATGTVYKNAQDKWKQINHYIEILSSTLEELPEKDKLKIVDMGSGKGYLTFALYDYLNTELGRSAHVEGVEYRPDLVNLCNVVAQRSGMDDLVFLQGGIEDYVPQSNLDVLIALHACDTATDEAIYKGIQHQAELIVTAPCCHKQIRRQLEQHKTYNDLDFMTQHGIFLERHAEMLTDSLRALILEYAGYKTKVVQFISDAHTPKNIMIIAVKAQITDNQKQEILTKIKSSKAYFGVGYHHLERLMELEKV